MAPQVASIQSFFQPEVQMLSSSPHKRSVTHKADTGDGFTSSEVEAALHPTLHKWQPRTNHEERDIGSLVPGPGCVTVIGRVVNFYDQSTPSKMPQAAKGCLKVIVKDDTGAFAVKLWYAKMEYQLRLGHLVSVWTPHISNANPGSLTLQDTSLVTSIFPERDNSCYFMVQEKSDEGVLCKTPLGYRDGKQLDGLITLKNYIDGGHEISGGRVLVCVKSIGGRKKFTTKKGIPTEKVDVHIFDDTADATLTLWGRTTASASYWKTSSTILLLSNAMFRNDRKPAISLSQNTHIDVDPCMEDAYWLRGYAQRLTKREHVNQPFPVGVFDVDEAMHAEIRILFTLADIDEFARAAPSERFIGYLSLTIVDLNIYSLYQRNMLLCAECCGVPIFANATSTKCKQCEQDVLLRINPRLVCMKATLPGPMHFPDDADTTALQVGLLIDETGSIASGKLIWSDEAWEQLLGRNAEELATATSNTPLLKYLDNRLLFLKLAVMFGWSEEVGKLVILSVAII